MAKALEKSLALLLCSGAAMVLGGTAAQAQEAGDIAEQPASEQEVVPDASPATAADQGLEEIIVTAERREARLQDVPIAVSALSASGLQDAGIVSTPDIVFAVPSLNFTRQLNGMAPFIRGIGNKNGSPGDESAVGLYVDGVYYASLSGGVFALNNVERVEVLRGPQGTLFGRNSAGGVIHIITRDPQQEFSADLSLGYANYDTIEATAYLTGGITENIAADLSVYFMNQGDGWGRNLVTGSPTFIGDEFQIRTKWMFTPGPSTTIRFTAEYGRETPILTPWLRPPVGGQVIGDTPYSGFFNVLANVDSTAERETWGGNLQIRHDFGDAALLSITSYRDVFVFSAFDQDGSPQARTDIFNDTFSRTWTQELQLSSSPASRIQWVIGAYYFRDASGYSPNAIYTNGVLTSARYPTLTSESVAGYAQATVPIFESTRVTGGVRYTLDNRTLNSFQYAGPTGGVILGPPGTIGQVVQQSSRDNAFTYRLSVDHSFTRDFLVYASASRGFKSGLFATTNVTQPGVRPEFVDTYEIGIKTDWLNRRLRFNLAGFLNRFKDIQLQQALTGGTRLLNAASASIDGFELELTAMPITNFQIGLAVTYLDARFTDFPNAPAQIPAPSGNGTNVNIVVPNAAGNPTQLAPPWVVSGNAQYVIPMGSSEIAFGGTVYYNDGYAFDFINRVRQEDYTLVNAFIEWRSSDERYSVRLWGRNITDARYTSNTSILPAGDLTVPAAPRTYGVTARIRL